MSIFLPLRNYSERIRSLQTLLRYVCDVVQGSIVSVVNHVPRDINFYSARIHKFVIHALFHFTIPGGK